MTNIISKLIFLALMVVLSVLLHDKAALFASGTHIIKPEEKFLNINDDNYTEASCNCQTYITLINSNDATIQLDNSTIVKDEATYGSYRPQ